MKRTTRDVITMGVAVAVALFSLIYLCLPHPAVSQDALDGTSQAATGETAGDSEADSPEDSGEEGEAEQVVEEEPEPYTGIPTSQVVSEVQTQALRQASAIIDPDRLFCNTPEFRARELYVTTWAERIDAFNAGYPLEGYGEVFAEAAYENEIDPRFSPAIARIESASGSDCFLPHNAWGWGRESWPDWETAIRAHVKALAENYGYTLTWETAEYYNGLYVDDWYNLVGSCMSEIWPYDGI